MLNFIRKSLVIEIHNFVDHFSTLPCKRINEFTSSAYVQARKKIKAEVFEALTSVLVQEFYTDNELGVKKWKGFKLLGIDGSTVNLPWTDAVAEKYGYAKNQTGNTNVQARVSVLYDVLNRIAIDGSLNARSTSERNLALVHLEQCTSSDLVIFDRGYYSFDFLEGLEQINVVFRLKSDLKAVKQFIESGKRSKLVEMSDSNYISKKGKTPPARKPIKVRLVRVELPNGEIEVLATSLICAQKYPSSIFKDLYFQRWKVETYYDELKNKLKVECFTGYSDKALQQDFHAALFISNIQSIIVNEMEDELTQETQKRKLSYKVNTNLSYGFLKNKIITLLFSENEIGTTIEELKRLFKKYPIPIRPNRSFKRNKQRRTTKRLQVTKNQRDTI